VLVGPGNNAAEFLNRGFFKRMRSGLPWVVVKTAVSLDGMTALASGESQWITSEAARKDGHRLRSVAGAILTGAGTVLRDDPRLTVRHVKGERQPTRVIVDSNLSTPEDAQVLQQSGKTIIFCANAESADSLTARYSELDIVPCPTPSGQVDLGGVLSELARREINSVLVEAGEKLCGNLVNGRLVDEFVVYMAPDLLGSKGRSMVNIPAMESLQDRVVMEFVDCTRIGRDLRLTLKPAYH